MRKVMDKLLSKIKINKKVLIFLLTLALIALISGSIFVVLLDKGDKTIITNYLNDFINSVSQNKIEYTYVLKDSLLSSLILVIGIWLLGISVIGIPIILFLFFSQIFTFSFSIASIILNYKFKGLLLALIYTFPNYLLFLLMLLILVSYALILSIKLITSVLKKKQIDFKIISNKYLIILLFSICIAIFYSCYETFILPNIIRLILPILK